MNEKSKESRATTAPISGNAHLNFSGGGKILVSVASIIGSKKVKEQVKSVTEIKDAVGKAASKDK